MSDTSFFDATNDLICTIENIRGLEERKFNEEDDFDHHSENNECHSRPMVKSNVNISLSSLDILSSIIAPPIQKCKTHNDEFLVLSSAASLSPRCQQALSSRNDKWTNEDHSMLYQHPRDDFLMNAARRRIRQDKHKDTKRDTGYLYKNICNHDNEARSEHSNAFKCFDAFRKEIYDFIEKQKLSVKSGQLLPSNELQSFVARVEHAYQHLGDENLAESIDNDNILKDKTEEAVLIKTKQVIDAFLKRCKRRDLTLEKLQLFSGSLYKKQAAHPSKGRKVLHKFKYWTCKLCGKNDLRFERRTCAVCGRPKMFHPSSPILLMVTNSSLGGAVWRKSDDSLREGKSFPIETFHESKKVHESRGIDERIQRQYLYKKVDFDSETRTSLRNEVKDLLGSIASRPNDQF
jgi:rubrerythrin